MQPEYTWSRNQIGSSRSTPFIRIFQVGFMFSVLPASLISSTYTGKNRPFSRLTKNIPSLKLSPHRISMELSQIVVPTILLPEDDRTDSFREERLDLPYWTMILAICVLRRIQMSGHSDFGIFNNFEASSISPGF